ncbi:dynein heavy chain 2, axonemal [Nilaparvata lugens]|uniref:dynein heavy chain 2, axonemal n=1 Tax=Nilaparvata lugens TaxID=108931 RepID=UPI00193E4FCB|nr:dynein heavy chain 2, axonemal [Nilaparvata lugens]
MDPTQPEFSSSTAASSETEETEEKTEKSAESESEPEIIKTPSLESVIDEEEVKKLATRFKKITQLFNLKESDWNSEHDMTIWNFCKEDNSYDKSNVLCVFFSKHNLMVKIGIPKNVNSDLFYFIKNTPGTQITVENVLDSVTFGSVGEIKEQTILDVTKYVYSPMFFNATHWPNSVKNEFSSRLYSFIEYIDDLTYKFMGLTSIFMPLEAKTVNLEQATRDRQLIKRIESCVLAWICRIRMAIGDKDQSSPTEMLGLIDEVEFWKYRFKNLNLIRVQLDNENVQFLIKILTTAQSPDVQQLESVSDDLDDALDEAVSNFQFLHILEESANALMAVEDPKDLIPLLPKAFFNIKLILESSPYYDTRDKAIVLYSALSNLIIVQCTKYVDLSLVFEGKSRSAIAMLKKCIDCCQKYKIIYKKAQAIYKNNNKEHCVINENDEELIFNQVNTFIQRCKDVLEICDCMITFARLDETVNMPKPEFGLTKGIELEKICEKVETDFINCLSVTEKVQDTILDVRSSVWYEEILSVQKFLPNQDLIYLVLNYEEFSVVTNVFEGLSTLQSLYQYSKQPNLYPIFEQKTVEVYKMYIEEIQDARNDLVQAKRQHPSGLPKYAGRALVARLKRKRMENLFKQLEECQWMIRVPLADEVHMQYQKLLISVDDVIRHYHKRWIESLRKMKNIKSKLHRNLIIRSAHKPGYLENNIDRKLMSIYHEAFLWMKLEIRIPVEIDMILALYTNLRVLKGGVTNIVIHYNRILQSLSDQERVLFREMLNEVDQIIKPGITKYDWELDEEASHLYVSQCLRSLEHMQEFVDSYKSCNLEVVSLCEKICSSRMLDIPVSRIYELRVVQQKISAKRKHCARYIVNLYNKILKMLQIIFEEFVPHLSRMEVHLRNYFQKVDSVVQESLVVCVRESLKNMFRVLHGDGIGGPMIHINVIASLKNREITFSPSMIGLIVIFSNVLNDMVLVMNLIPRLTENFRLKQQVKSLPYAAVIAKDAECIEIQHLIEQELVACFSKMKEFVKSWKIYRTIWEKEKKLFLEKYEHRRPKAECFNRDIGRYSVLIQSVEQIEPRCAQQFLMINCDNIKDTIIKHCKYWQFCLIQLLSRILNFQIEDLYRYTIENAHRLTFEPKNSIELHEYAKLLEMLTEESTRKESQFSSIKDKIDIFHKYEFTVNPNIIEREAGLQSQWSKYLTLLHECGENVVLSNETFKTTLIGRADNLKKDVKSLLSEFNAAGPFTSALKTSEAIERLKDFRSKLEAFKSLQKDVKNEFISFVMDYYDIPELESLEKDLNILEVVLKLADKWDKSLEKNKAQNFWQLDVDKFEMYAQGIYRQLNNLFKELRDKNWEIIDFTRRRVDFFIKLVPLMNDLKNKALKERHWNRIRQDIGHDFDENSDEFTLEIIQKYNMHLHADKIYDISDSATRELQIENNMKAITEAWDNISIDTVQHKDLFRIVSIDDIFNILEEHLVSIAAMKATRFVEPFFEDVDHWERTLSLVLEIFDGILNVQRKYLYLENIFSGEDIRSHLPKETAEFDACLNEWRSITKKIRKDRLALAACKQVGLLKALQRLDAGLENIQKALEAYLETKRNVFPRFYFISNDDLLEILGSSRKPEQVQPHLKKCFDNITKLRISKIAAQKHDSNSQKFEATGMFSADGELVEFSKPVLLEGSVELWLCAIETVMRLSLRDQLKQVRLALRKNLAKRDKWIKEYPGQLCITSSQIQWTMDCTRSLMACKVVDSKLPLKKLKKKQNKVLATYSEAIRGNLTKLQRLKVVSLVTIEIHARDVIEKMYKANCKDITAFEWLAQLRFYWDRDVDDCIVRQTNTKFSYGYEYLGNSGRLVITPLTDRCYITLTTALHLHRGGSPKGPAGTGKTETVKDLGKALANYVIVINCSEGLDFKSMGHMFSGFAQSGAWGCFDEFNRINVEVLSVVAQQILSVLTALTQGVKMFTFEGKQLKLNPTCGIFITMNPGYAGRTELPDNLKSMFRPISMMVPDCMLIAEITLFGEGFRDCRALAKKVDSLFSLARQQLSKQDHYDFGLRGMVSLLRYAGRKRRLLSNIPDDSVMLLAIRDMNVAKLASDDLPLFNGITKDLFPGIELPAIDYQTIVKEIQKELISQSLQDIQIATSKVIQLYETKMSRHSVMLVGKTGTAKSTTWKVLRNILTYLKKENVSGFESVTEYPINPKALGLGELYGEFNVAGEWTDGVLSSIMRKVCSDEGTDEKWILFDGPVDAVWIENMNSVMDDNKVLTLINSERITMPEQVSLLFEVEDLSVASPATVSRCGMVYNDYKDFGWEPYVNSWLEYQTPCKEYKTCMKAHIDRYLQRLLDFVRLQCELLIPVPEICVVKSLCNLLSSLATAENGLNLKKYDLSNFETYSKLWFLFCLTWSVCAVVNEDGRKKIDGFIRDLEGVYPMKDTIYEYYVDVDSCTFKHWENLLPTDWKLNSELPFYKIIVPTVDTLRYQFLAGVLIRNNHPVLLVGAVGTGKTQSALSCVEGLDSSKYSLFTINMSAQTSSKSIQDAIESKVEKRTKGVYTPIGNKTMITFMDDLNMPVKEIFGAQPPLELIRQWIDYGFWYDRQKQFLKHIRNLQLIGAMGPPGGGRNHISNRLLSRFSVINLAFPNESDICLIFGTMLQQHTTTFDDSVRQLWRSTTDVTVKLYMDVSSKMLPTPTKMHYLFNIRDISKIFQGLLRSTTDHQNSRTSFLRLWIHETFRVFGDRLNNESDKEWLVEQVNLRLGRHLDLTLHGLCPGKELPIFANFLNPYQMYEDIHDMQKLRLFLEEKMEEYNMSPGKVKVDLVLFKDAIDHICRISRVISQPRGNMLLVGTGGSGRQSLSHIAAHLCDYITFQIHTSKSYKLHDFKEDLKSLYYTAGVKDTPTSFLFVDNQISEETFLEIINNVLSTGEVSNLYKPEEFEDLKTLLTEPAKKAGKYSEQIYGFFIERVRANLHIIVCLSPIGEEFRSRLMQCPSLVNCTTINWIIDWPRDALLEVAEKFLTTVDLCTTINGLPRVEDPTENIVMTRQERLQKSISNVMAEMHVLVSHYSRKMLAKYKRYNYVTPTNYLGLLSRYIAMLYIKREEVAEKANKLRNGVWKIDETRVKVEEMSIELEKSTVQVDQLTVECDGFLVMLRNQKKTADDQQRAVTARSVRIKEEEKACRLLADVALADLQEAMPALEEAIQALEALNKKDITEIRSYGRPPAKVEMVMEAVMILKQVEPTWAEAKRQLGDVNFLNQLKEFDKDHISDRTLKKIAVYTSNEEFEPEKVGIVSAAAKSLCLWVRAIEKYGKIYRIVAPKKLKLDEALASLNEKQSALAEAMAKLDDLHKLIEKLKQDYDERMAVKEELRKKAELLKLKLERAAMLVDGLSGEKTRWIENVATLDERFELLIGDCLLCTGFLTYCGPFMSQYREKLMARWRSSIVEEELNLSADLDLVDFLSDQATIQEWNIAGLPTDMFSTENGLIIFKCACWPLIIDPQGQALKWLKNMEKGLIVIDSSYPNIAKLLEDAIVMGNSVLIQNVGEILDSALRPVLNRHLTESNGRTFINFGDRLINYNRNFRLFLVTKLANPHFPPEVCTYVGLVNFTIKEEGLEAQLLGIVVRKEKPKLEEDKTLLVQNITSGKRMLIELEDELLRLLNESEGSLLDNLELINTLQTSKETSTSIKEQLINNLENEIKIDTAREGYRECANRASILFFVLNDMSKIDPMYQFSLDWYLTLFSLSIDKSTKSESLSERLRHLNDYHTYAVYRNACRALFEKHKLLFSFHTCVKILESANKIIATDYEYLLKGGVVLNREGQAENPCPSWMGDTEWDNIAELDKLPGFHGVVGSFEQYSREWKEWFLSTEPERRPLVGEWQNVCKEFQRMLFVRALRCDRLTFCISSFVASTLGERFIEPPVLDIKSVVDDSNYKTPLVFVLSPGADPAPALITLTEKFNMTNRFHYLSLGQGQAPIATALIEAGLIKGDWIFLANCHLSLSWMPKLDKIIENISQNTRANKDFRLWLSSSPHPEFPISILQNSLKMTTEPPKGIKANMKRLYQNISDAQFQSCSDQSKYKKLLYALCFFHSILIERKKFQQLGWNIIYSFNDSDFEVSENLLSIYLDEYPESTPFDALKYLIAGVNYGGHVTDDWDRRLLTSYINQYFCEETISVPFHRLSELGTYYVPKDGSLQSYKDFVVTIPNIDQPQVFGQHTNADITSLIIETKLTCELLMSLQVQSVSKSSENVEESVMRLANDIMSKVPDDINYETTIKNIGAVKTPLQVVLLQEVQRYNVLLNVIKSSLDDVIRGIQGFVLMSPELEAVFNALNEGRVPLTWQKAYSSLKNLGSWVRDLILRVQHFTLWANTLRPPLLFWLSAYTYPNGFLTAVLQTSARQLSVSIDVLSWEFIPQAIPEHDITIAPKEGVLIRGMFLEGAGWDNKNLCLAEPKPLQLIVQMPVTLFRPCEQTKLRTKGLYVCPTYYFPLRCGSQGRESFVIAVDLKSGEESADHWVKRATALLLSLSS